MQYNSSSKRTRPILIIAALSLVLLTAVLLCVFLAGSRRALRLRSEALTAQRESAEAEVKAVDENKRLVWYARRNEVREATDELKAQIDDNAKSRDRAKAQVEQFQEYLNRTVRANLGTAYMETVSDWLNETQTARADGPAGSAEASE